MLRFDILMPYYGDPALMRKAVRSVLAQDGSDWRLTVVDDGTEPEVPDWFADLRDDRVRYLRNPVNLGVTGNFNRCAELAEAPYAVFMGCDDLMLPGYLAAVRGALASSPDAGIVQPGVEVVDAAGQVVLPLVDRAKRLVYAPRLPPAGERLMLQGERAARSLLRGNWLYFPSLCWRTAAVRRFGFRPELRVIQDLALVLDLLLDGESLVVAPEVVFRYRRHGGSESASAAVGGERFAEARAFFAEAAERLERHGWPEAAAASRRHLSSRVHALTLLPGAMARGRWSGAARLVRHACGAGAARP
ncbi:glycosyl transferase family 2 [Mangrovactinospora gilvigrisea]|uniref:Glycosyl transferase family 2 n=2 Tax=Mangrovactinospora gilvigrisea TaxID=1428644 RepID=A0A1J7BSG0_9ACTN|nr:glycosyl transferase family 2 [Mangrovactinospora gilvigrisea]